MKPDPRFQNLGPSFWALVKYASEQNGYSTRKTKQDSSTSLKKIGPDDIFGILEAANFSTSLVPKPDVILAADYISFRADALADEAAPNLMNREQARLCFLEMRGRINPKLPPTLNRQKGEKRHEAYLASMVAMVAEDVLGTDGFVNDTQALAFVTQAGVLQYIFSRRFDGALPGVRNPRAVWEIKEYYGTTSFGSRVADGVYETLLDGYEIRAAHSATGHHVAHYLFVDDYFTWWGQGKPYLCRIVDMLHTGHVDEVFFGRQVATRWPSTLRNRINLPDT